MEYSWDIRMYRVCVGYVSGMYRESVEGNGARGSKGEERTWVKSDKQNRHLCPKT